MFKRRPYLISLAPGLALLLLATPFAQCGQSSQSLKNKSSNAFTFKLKDYAKPVRFDLVRLRDGRACAHFAVPNANQTDSQDICAVDDYKVRDRFLFDIARRFAGQSDTSVTIKYIERDLSESSVTLKRVAAFRPGSNHSDVYFAQQLVSANSASSKTFRDGYSNLRTIDDSISGALDQMAAVYRNIDLEVNHPYKSSLFLLNAVYDGAFLALQMGDFEQADKYSRLIQNADDSELSKVAKSNENNLAKLSFAAKDYSLAEKLTKALMLDTGSREKKNTIESLKDSQEWLALFHYAQVLHAKQDSHFKETVNRLYKYSDVFAERDITIPIELANWLVELGEVDKARNCLKAINKGCDSALRCLENKDKSSVLNDLTEIVEATCAYADFETKHGKPELAVKGYCKLIEFFERHFSEVNWINQEKIDSTKHRFTDICKGLALAYDACGNHRAEIYWLNRALNIIERAEVTYVPEYSELKELLEQANKHVEQANLETKERRQNLNYAAPESASLQLKVTSQERFDLLRQAYQVLKDKDEERSWEALNKLIDNYKALGRLGESQLNFYYCLLEFARSASDSGSYNLSDRVLNELANTAPLLERNPSVLGWIEIEQQVNNCRKDPNKTDWSNIVQNDLFENIMPAERCRLISKQYYLAHDYARARLFADKAIELASTDVLQRGLALLNSCCLNMKTSLLADSPERDFSKKTALALLNEAVNSTIDYKPYSDPQQVLSYEKEYRHLLAETASVAAETKLATDVLPLLELASKHLPKRHEAIAEELDISSTSKATKTINTLQKAESDISDRKPLFYFRNDFSDSDLTFGMVKCLIALDRYEEAYKLLSSSECLTDNFSPRSELESAKLAVLETCGTAKEKRALYSEILEAKDLRDSALAENLISGYTTKLKMIKVPQEEQTASQLYEALLNTLSKKSAELGSLRLTAKAIPNTNEMRRYLMQLTQQVEQTKDNAPRLASLAKDVTNHIFEAISKEPKLLSGDLLYDLALWEAKHGRQEQCLRHTLKAVEESNEPIDLSFQSNKVFEIINCLDTNGATKTADSLLSQYLKVRQKKFGKLYTGYLTDRASAFLRSIRLKRENEASDHLKEIQSIDSRKIENSLFTEEVNPVVSITLAMGGKISLKKLVWLDRTKEMPSSLLELRLSFLKKIISYQLKTLPADHFSLALTHLSIGEVLAQLGRKKEAHTELQSAWNILDKHKPHSDILETIESLKDELNVHSAKRDTKAIKTAEPSKSQEATKKSTREATKKSAYYGDIQNTSLHSETEPLDLQTRINLFSQLYQETKEVAPYSDRCCSLLRIMADDCEKVGDFKRQASALADLVSIYEHRNILELSIRKISFAWRNPCSFNRLELYRRLVTALKQDKQIEAAKSYATKAAEFIPSDARSLETEALERIRAIVN